MSYGLYYTVFMYEHFSGAYYATYYEHKAIYLYRVKQILNIYKKLNAYQKRIIFILQNSKYLIFSSFYRNIWIILIII